MWREKIILRAGERLDLVRSWCSGTMQEQDNDLFDVIGEDGKIGEVRVEVHTALRGFRRTGRVIQRDSAGNVIRDANFSPD